jgi:hypothetical protein
MPMGESIPFILTKSCVHFYLVAHDMFALDRVTSPM